MKCAFIVYIIGIIFLTKTQSHVTREFNTTEVTTISIKHLEAKSSESLRAEVHKSENVPANNGKSENNLERQKSAKSELERVYLEDVVFALKSQNWTADELPCLNRTLLLLRSLQNFTLWAVWDWDSISSQPHGLLYGNRYELGNFDECLDAPWLKNHPELSTQYCLAEIVLERTDHAVRHPANPAQPYQSALDYMLHRPAHMRPLNLITWGGCMPAVCRPRAVERLMSTMLAHSHLGTAGLRPRISVTEPCQTTYKPRPFDGLFYAFIAITVGLVIIAVTCTYLNITKSADVLSSSFKNAVIESFCMRNNLKNLGEMKKEGIEVLYGIRFFTICFVVMDHQLGIHNAGPVINGHQVDKDAISYGAMFVLHGDLFVDTFFLLSGFLTAVIFKKLKKLPNPFLVFLKRYLRLVVAFAVVIFFYCAVFPHIGSGPLWNRAIAGDTDPCLKTWWIGLLMLGNYVENENICIVISWYIPCDFHFFVVSVLGYWLYRRAPKLGLTCAGVVGVASVIVPGVLNYIHQLPAVQTFTYEFVSNPRASEQFHLEYIKSHTRFSPYLIGFFSGYIFASYQATGNLKIISKKWSSIGACAGLTIMTVVMIIGPTYLWRSYSPIEGAFYAALNRPLWAIGLAMLILCCAHGNVPVVEQVLSWYPLVPLSRLAYGLYLTHTMMITRNVFTTRSPQYNDYFYLLTSGLGTIVMGCVAGLLIWLLIEAPINNLVTSYLKTKVNPKEFFEDRHIEQNKSISTIDTEGSGYLHSNLSSSIGPCTKI